MNDRVRNRVADGLAYDDVRVPCDLRRYGVTNVPWRPYKIVDADIKSTAGLVSALCDVLDGQQASSGLCCLLMDVNIFWRVLKLVYAVQKVPANVMGCLRECVPLLGVWHAYAHSLKKVYERFLQWWACLENAAYIDFPEECTVYTRPRVIVIEQLVMGLFLAAPNVAVEMRRTEQVLKQQQDDAGQAWVQFQGLRMLMTEYCPLLVDMGISVRQCFWPDVSKDVDSGDLARRVLRDALVLSQAVQSGGSSEYLRNLCLMDLLWGRIHQHLPAASYVEECLESSLSTLGRRLRTDPRATTVQSFSDTYTQWCTAHSGILDDVLPPCCI
jgi:hypothetical protein